MEPIFDRFQIVVGKLDNENIFAVCDSDLDIIVAVGTLEEMKTYKEQRQVEDKMILWK